MSALIFNPDTGHGSVFDNPGILAHYPELERFRGIQPIRPVQPIQSVQPDTTPVFHVEQSAPLSDHDKVNMFFAKYTNGRGTRFRGIVERKVDNCYDNLVFKRNKYKVTHQNKETEILSTFNLDLLQESGDYIFVGLCGKYYYYISVTGYTIGFFSKALINLNKENNLFWGKLNTINLPDEILDLFPVDKNQHFMVVVRTA